MSNDIASDELPQDWAVTRLGDLAEVKYGRAKPDGVGDIPVVGSGGVFARANRALVEFPTLVIGRKGTAGKVWFMDGPSWPSDTAFYLEWKGEIDVLFLHGYLTLRPLSGEHAKTTLPSLQRPDLENYLVPVPPLPEQRRIAHVLSTIQRAIQAQDAVITAARELKRSLMHRLFTYGPYAEPLPTKETEIGEVPEWWAIVRLGKLVAVRGGKRLPKGESYEQGSIEFPYIRVVDFRNQSVDRSNLRYISPQLHHRLRHYVISSDDVYISIAGSIGLVGTVPRELDNANLTENAARLVIGDKGGLDRDFLMWALASERGQTQIRIRTAKTSQPKLALVRIRDIPIPLPEIEEQRTIAQYLNTMAAQVAVSEQRKVALEALFKSTLHQLMTGQVRVGELEGVL